MEGAPLALGTELVNGTGLLLGTSIVGTTDIDGTIDGMCDGGEFCLAELGAEETEGGTPVLSEGEALSLGSSVTSLIGADVGKKIGESDAFVLVVVGLSVGVIDKIAMDGKYDGEKLSIELGAKEAEEAMVPLVLGTNDTDGTTLPVGLPVRKVVGGEVGV